MRYTSFLDAVHRLARLAAEQDDYLDVYGLADTLREEHQALRLSRTSVAHALMEVGVAHSASMLLDPASRKIGV